MPITLRIGISNKSRFDDIFLKRIEQLKKRGINCFLVIDNLQELPNEKYNACDIILSKVVLVGRSYYYSAIFTNCEEDFSRKKAAGLNIQLIGFFEEFLYLTLKGVFLFLANFIKKIKMYVLFF